MPGVGISLPVFQVELCRRDELALILSQSLAGDNHPARTINLVPHRVTERPAETLDTVTDRSRGDANVCSDLMLIPPADVFASDPSIAALLYVYGPKLPASASSAVLNSSHNFIRCM